jgi:hypothetical protein
LKLKKAKSSKLKSQKQIPQSQILVRIETVRQLMVEGGGGRRLPP